MNNPIIYEFIPVRRNSYFSTIFNIVPCIKLDSCNLIIIVMLSNSILLSTIMYVITI